MSLLLLGKGQLTNTLKGTAKKITLLCPRLLLRRLDEHSLPMNLFIEVDDILDNKSDSFFCTWRWRTQQAVNLENCIQAAAC